MLHWWLIPILIALVLALWIFYLVIGKSGASGERTEGRTLMDKPEEQQDPPGKS